MPPPPRGYIPSAAVLRALSRPLPPRCPFAPRLPTQFVRGKRKASAKPPPIPQDPVAQGVRDLKKEALALAEARKREDALKEPKPDDTMNDMGLPEIEWWEQDLDKGTPERLISRIATRADLEKQEEMHALLTADERNEKHPDPNYDDTELKKRLIDDLIANPNFADLTGDLMRIKKSLKTKKERAEQIAQWEKEMEPEIQQIEAVNRVHIHEALQGLINDPELADVRELALDAQRKIPEGSDYEDPQFVAAMDRLEETLRGRPGYLEKMASLQQKDPETDAILEEIQKPEETLDEILNPKVDDSPVESADLVDLLGQMKELLVSMDGDKKLANEIDELMKENLLEQAELEATHDEEQEVDMDALVEEIERMKKSGPPPAKSEESVKHDEDGEDIDPELAAKVDKIMEDPRLMEKLAFITDIISKQQKRSLTNPDVPSAVDPVTLDNSELTTLGAQLKIAENHPEHIAAMRRLRIHLLPPFSVSPVLRNLNLALKYAYCCHNDDTRRILWRCYYKARTLPTLIQSMPDDAWDMLYYSQAVTWAGNQNRENHVRTILADLRRAGRDGPPTHPSTLTKQQAA